MKYLYESHLGGLYTSDDYIDIDELHCEECGDSDWLLGQFDSIEEFWNLIEDQVDICGESYYQENYTTTTAVYYPPIYKNGVNINPDRNQSATFCTCLNCGKNFTY